ASAACSIWRVAEWRSQHRSILYAQRYRTHLRDTFTRKKTPNGLAARRISARTIVRRVRCKWLPDATVKCAWVMPSASPERATSRRRSVALPVLRLERAQAWEWAI